MKIKKHLNFTRMRGKLSEMARGLPDNRDPKKTKISLHDAILSGFACMYFQDPSLLAFQKRLEDTENKNNLRTLFDVEVIPKETQMREIIDSVDSEHFRPVFKSLYAELQRGKHLEQYRLFDNMYYFPMDGSQFFSSKDVHCEQCLTKTYNKKPSQLRVLDEPPTEAEKADVLCGELILLIKQARGYVIGYCQSESGTYDETPLTLVDENNGSLEFSGYQSGEQITDKKMIERLHKHVSTTLGGVIQSGNKTFSHQVLQGGIMHPDCKQIIPFMPEQIVNADGSTKQDCEMNAGKRYLGKVKESFPQLDFLVGGDALFSKQPIIEDILSKGMHYLFVAKPTDHTYLFEQLRDYSDELTSIEYRDEKGRIHCYTWMNDVPLNGQKDTVAVNFLRYEMKGKNKAGIEKILYKNSWVTDIKITKDNSHLLVSAGRCRWKNENECFNVMKNHGYCMEHNYGHGKRYLAYNFYLLTLLAFTFHQIFELTDKVYQACRQKFGSKKRLWEILRSYIQIIVFDSWEVLLSFALKPTGYQLCPLGDSG